MGKANRILDDLLCIIAIIIFPMCILELLGYDKAAALKEGQP